MSDVDLYDVLKNSYADKKKQMEALKRNGYNYDSMLSNHNQQVYYNPNDKKLIVNVAGTHNLKDWATDAYLALGKLKDTSRYKEADKIFKEAKLKYSPRNSAVTGHSLGGSIAGYIAGNNDKVSTLNSGYTIGQHTKKNRTEYQVRGDVVSLLGTGQKHTKVLPPQFRSTGFVPIDILNSHKVENIKKSQIKI
jgi:tetratricopeptide (TPR) repeat protein